MNAFLYAAVATMTFACVGYLGVELGAAVCKGLTPFADGPRPGKPPILWLVLGTALIGGVIAWRGAGAMQLALAGIVCVSLVACWYCDVRCGIVPDYFTLVPLGAVLVAAAAQREWGLLLSAVVPFIPFAAAAFASKGRGMGWGDTKLAALGGAVLGIQTAILAFSVASVAAVIIAWIRGRKREPIAFAPYLAGAIGLSMILRIAP